MRSLIHTIFPILLGTVSLAAQDTIVPEFLRITEVRDVPYRYNGLLSVGNAIGSASMVGDGVFATAAHVIYDDNAMTWEPIADTNYYPKHHQSLQYVPQGSTYKPVAFARWTSYGARVQEDQDNGTPAGQSTPNTFNIDFAVGYVSSSYTLDEVTEHAEVHVDLEEEVGIFRDKKSKMIVGYPTDSDFIDSTRQGMMHRTSPDDYFCWWGGLTDLEQTWRDSENYWVSIYNFEGVTTYGGNSGGPMYVQEVSGNWSFAGIIVGSDNDEGVIVRSLDEGGWQLIEEAISARNVDVPLRIEDLSILSTTSSSVALAWSDVNDEEDGFLVFRNENGSWIQLASLPEDTEFYQDETVEPGHIYYYRVQPVGENGNRPPKSLSVSAIIPGSNTAVANHLGQWTLKFRNDGESNWYVDGSNRLRAGKVRSLGSSRLALEILGPGTLSFTWSVSSELNLDYSNPNSQNEGDIYDAIYLLLDGEPVMVGEEPVFLSGVLEAQEYQLSVPEGAHIVEWAYETDPYTSEEADTGYLDNLAWYPGPTDAYPVYGAYEFAGSDWHGSAWFGNYFTEYYPWIGHSTLGWLYLRPGDGYKLYLYSVIPELGNLYTTPFYYPYFYRLEQGNWIYVYPGTGEFGSELWYFDLETGQVVYIP